MQTHWDVLVAGSSFSMFDHNVLWLFSFPYLHWHKQLKAKFIALMHYRSHKNVWCVINLLAAIVNMDLRILLEAVVQIKL